MKKGNEIHSLFLYSRSMAYKIIFIDIDWTILDHNKHDWDYETIDVLKTLQNQGVLVYLCTARPYDSVVHTGLFEFFNPDGVICTNGGVVFAGDKLISANIIPEDIVRSIEKISNKHHLVLELSTNKERYFTSKVNKYVSEYFNAFSETIPDIRKYHNKEVSAILLFAPEKYDQILIQEFPKEINYLRFDNHGVDVTYFKNNKGLGIKKALHYLKIDKSEAIGAGDDLSDIPMFKEVGLSIALGNGKEEAKAAADIVCDHIGNNGLGKALQNIFTE